MNMGMGNISITAAVALALTVVLFVFFLVWIPWKFCRDLTKQPFSKRSTGSSSEPQEVLHTSSDQLLCPLCEVAGSDIIRLQGKYGWAYASYCRNSQCRVFLFKLTMKENPGEYKQ